MAAFNGMTREYSGFLLSRAGILLPGQKGFLRPKVQKISSFEYLAA
jgi:hypothetical protein